MASNVAFAVGYTGAVNRTTFTGQSVCRHSVEKPVDREQARWTMAKVSKFGPFTPAVIATKLVIGEKNLNRVRGKGIALHSQAITAFCEFTGAGPKMRQSLIRTAKENGNTLGFLS